MGADKFFEEREQTTSQRVAECGAVFERHLQKDGKRALENTCVYVVGSAGRGEMTKASDLDLFLVTHGEYKRTQEILAQAAVLRMMAEQDLPEASNDAGFLKLHTAESLAQRLGDVKDDFENTFTVRMLLLLESRCLYGPEAYDCLLEEVVRAYWRNEEGHPNNYLPLVLVNDIVRYWRVVILNYEAKYERKLRKAIEDSGGNDTSAVKAVEREKRFASYKLRFSRCMTCYSMIASLLAEATETDDGRAPHVSKTAFLAMVRSTPVKRLQQVREQVEALGDEPSVKLTNELLALYQEYLELRDRWGDNAAEELAKAGKHTFAKSNDFGEKMFQLIQRLGSRSPLYRYVVT